MERRSKIILGLLVVVLLSIIITEIMRPKPLNWRPSYAAESKLPFGCFILFNELSDVFPSNEIQSVEESVYSALIKRDSSQRSSYVLINDQIALDKQETYQILEYVARGNQVLIAANEIMGMLADTLNIGITLDYGITEDSVAVNFTNRKFKEDTFHYTRAMTKSYFSSIDTAKTEILGHISFTTNNLYGDELEKTRRRPNFIKTQFGEGAFFINSTPIGFTNYYLLKGNQKFAANTFSYLEDNLILWDDYKKSGRRIITSPMRFVLNQTALKWAYYLSILGILLFVLFKAKREQRIIPVINPLENSSVEFARTVGALYHQNKDYTNLNTKKINFLVAELRSKYYMDTSVLNDQTIEQLAGKSGKSLHEVKQLIDLILSLKNKAVHSEQDTIELSKKINIFKR